MKKILVVILGLAIVSEVYAKSYTMYVKADEKSQKLGQVDDQNPQYQAIFSKKCWFEIVNNANGQVGWVKQKPQNKTSKTIQNDPVAQMLVDFQKQQQVLDQHFDKVVSNIDNNVDQLTSQSGSSAVKGKPKVFKEFNSIIIDSNGKTAKIIKKTQDGSGNVKTVEKVIPANQLSNIKLQS
ncbi:hypothetical protein fh0823_15990 [Francisella halioticida]|uniref:Outer membrane protein n=1 Tax=Francisella halioticida TaxID=549298 RepID=A0ABN5B499_9GAMM|nr:hypothetical protein [Francisella halioticida]ASG68558.1 hypothetical protein CDV26_09280 [Francisella halioticida]BCD91460.1 hypothetical protein fh0823_15990 [Francisella halioticida]